MKLFWHQIGNFIFTITRISENKNLSKKFSTRKNVKISRKKTSPDTLLSIYKFNSFDDFCEFCTYISNIIPLSTVDKLKNSMLYEYDSSYYLILKNIRIAIEDFNTFCSAITEFAILENSGNLFEYKLKEYGKIVLKKNAISTALKYFG